MAVTALKPYIAEPSDPAEKYDGKQLVFVSWDHHLLFAAPFLLCLPTDTPFRALVEGPLTALLAPDPDAAKIDWASVKWLRANKPFAPDFDRTLAENGVRHKDQLRIQTPGLNSLLPED